MNKVILLMVLSLSILLTLSCQNAVNDTTNNTPNVGGEDTDNAESIPEDPYEKFKDSVGEHNFNGEEFKIQVFDNANNNLTVDVETETGDPYNDAMYRRNRDIEERFNVVIKQIITSDDGLAKTKSTIIAGDTESFDIFLARCPNALSVWQEGLAYSYDDIPYIDLSKPYWIQSANKTLTLKGNQYVAIGDFNINAYFLSHTIIFNKGMIGNFNLDNPYNLVNNEKWTFDKMEEMMKVVINDVNGDGIMDDNDRYGYLANPKEVLPSFWIAADTFSVGKDSDDIPYLAMGSEKFITAFDKTFNILWDSGAYYKVAGGPDIPENAIKMFGNNQSLFMDMTFIILHKIRGMETDFGIIPYPKINEAQNDYVSRIEYYMTFNVPVITLQLERAGIMLEVLNSYSATSIIPVFYDNALKAKAARDEESEKMIDLILRTLVVDIGDTTLCDKIRDGFVAKMFETNDRNLTSKLASTETIIQNFIEKIPQ